MLRTGKLSNEVSTIILRQGLPTFATAALRKALAAGRTGVGAGVDQPQLPGTFTWGLFGDHKIDMVSNSTNQKTGTGTRGGRRPGQPPAQTHWSPLKEVYSDSEGPCIMRGATTPSPQLERATH